MRFLPYLILLAALAGLCFLSPWCSVDPGSRPPDSATVSLADDPKPAPAGALPSPGAAAGRRVELTPSAPEEVPPSPSDLDNADDRFEVRGRLLYPDARPAGQAFLVLYDALSAEEVFGGRDTMLQERAEDDGGFLFRAAAGDYCLAVWHTEGQFLSEASFEVAADLDLGILTMRAGALAELTVVSAADGSPIEKPFWRLDGVFEEIRAIPRLPLWKTRAIWGMDYFDSYLRGEPEGNRIVIRSVPAGAHLIEVWAQGFAEQGVELEFRDDQLTRRLVELQPEGRLLLTVLHADGSPVQRETVNLWPEAQIGQRRLSGSGYGELDEDGRVEIRRVPPGTHRVVIGESRGLDEFLTRIEVVSGDNPIELVMPDLGDLRCRVIDGRGPVAGAMVYVTALDGNPNRALAQGMGDPRCDEQGVRLLPDLPAGRYRVQASRPGSFACGEEIEHSGSDQVVELRFAGATLSGRIEGGDGPVRFSVRGWRVDPWLDDLQADALIQDPERRPPWISGGDLTAEDGSYVLRDVLPGRYKVAIQDRSYAQAETDSFRVLDQDLVAPTLRLVKSGSLLVRVTGTGGSWSREDGSFRGHFLQLHLEGRRGQPFQELDHDGEYRFSLDPGSWKVLLQSGGGKDREPAGWQRELSVASGQERVLELDLRQLR